MKNDFLNIHLSHLFPKDTRSVEYVSAVTLVIASFSGTILTYLSVNILNTFYIWGVFLAVIGCCHLISLLMNGAYKLRALSCYTTAPFWIWVGVYELQLTVSLSGLLFIILGIAIFYSAILHFVREKRRWEK